MTAAPSFVEAARTHARLRPNDPAILEAETGAHDTGAAAAEASAAGAEAGAALSWAELDRWADAFAARLTAAGIVAGDRVGLVAVSSAAVVVAFHAMLRSGIVAVPLGPRLTQPEMTAIVEAAACRAFLTSTLQLELLPGRGSPPAPSAAPSAALSAALSSLPAIIVPTSGTTGRPKLVRLGLAQLDASAAAWSAVLPPATGWLLSLNVAHVAGIGIVVRAARAGVPVVVPVPGDEPILPSLAAARSAGIEVSHISLVTPQLARLLESPAAPPPELLAVLLGGGPIPESLVTRALAAGWPVFPGYGMTETASGLVAATPEEAARRPSSAGRPLPGAEVRVQTPDAAGTGEILVRGPMVFDTYESDPEATAAALDPEGWLHTGDLGSLGAEGWLHVVARRDEMIISGGENVAPAEIEAVLAAHPAVADVGVVGAPDERWGAVPIAIVAFRPGWTATEADLRAFAAERLASFKVPARFVISAAVPRSPNGKLLRRALPSMVGTAGRRPSLAGTTTIRADDCQPLAIRDIAGPAGAPTVLLLHATLSTSGQLLRLARLLGPDVRVLSFDRRGSGASAMAVPGPVSIARHVGDILAVLDAAGVDRPIVFGHSFGALLAIEFAARHPDRAASVVAYEPPYLAVASPALLARLAPVAEAVPAAYQAGGPAAAAQLFVRTVAGDEAWDRFGPAQQALLEAEGSGALADVSMTDLDPAGLARIACPVLLATGGASDGYYAPIADALVALIPGSRRVAMPGLRHPAPITDPELFATLIREAIWAAVG